MSDKQKGGCHCGAIKLSFPTEAAFSFSCHCDTCQKLVSGGRLLGMGVPADSISVEGDVANYSYKGGSEKNITLSFCPTCSAQLYAAPEAIENTVVIRSNALANPSSFEPEQVVFAEEACKWDKVA